MNESVIKSYTEFVLPPTIVTKADVSRLVSELERVDNDLVTGAVRAKVGSEAQVSPVLSDQLSDFLRSNELTLDDSNRRTELVKQARLLKDKAPVIHMTFAVAADRASLGSLVEWLRREVNAQTLIAVGLQPALVAGAYIRTPNHVHDFSLRGVLREKHSMLVEQIGSLRGSK